MSYARRYGASRAKRAERLRLGIAPAGVAAPPGFSFVEGPVAPGARCVRVKSQRWFDQPNPQTYHVARSAAGRAP